MKKGMTINQIRAWNNERWWQITLNANLSRAIHREGLVHAEVYDVNGKMFISFIKPNGKNQKNVSTNQKGKTACNAYMRRQTLIEPIVKHFGLQKETSYFITISNNTAKVDNVLTYQLLHTGKVVEKQPKNDEGTPIQTTPSSKEVVITMLGRMYFSQSYAFQKEYSETYHTLLKYIMDK